jgi:C4-dicarboxylate transporter DctQ subunit
MRDCPHKSAMTRMAALYDRLIDALAMVAAMILGGLSVWVTYDVIVRYFFRSPTNWAVDLSEYALLWVVFLASPWVLRQEAHVTLNVLIERLRPRQRRLLRTATSLAGAAVCALMTWHGTLGTWDLYIRAVDFGREWQVRQYAVYLIIPIGFLLLTIESLRMAYRAGMDGEAVSAAQTGRKLPEQQQAIY